MLLHFQPGSRGTLLFLCLLIIASIHPAGAQEITRNAFSSLNVPSAARIGGLGGVNVSLTDRDPNTFLSNPGTVGDSLSGIASLNYQFYVGDIGHAAFTYLSDFGKVGLVGIGVEHFSFGTINGFDPAGNPLSDYSASETAIVLSKSHQVHHFRFGINVKGAFGSLAGFRSSALVADIGGVFIHPDKNFQIGMVLKNAGFIISEYTGTSDSALPIDLQIGATIKPEHMPFRFSVTAYRLIGSEAIEDQDSSPSGLDKVLRHFNFGGELLLHRNVNVLFGYNYGVHQELRLENAGGSAGISYGFSARIKTVEFVFSRRTLAAGSAGYAFTLSTDVDRLFRRN